MEFSRRFYTELGTACFLPGVLALVPQTSSPYLLTVRLQLRTQRVHLLGEPLTHSRQVVWRQHLQVAKVQQGLVTALPDGAGISAARLRSLREDLM